MTLLLYMDVHVSSAITGGLRRRGVNVLTAQDDGADTLPDPALLDRATTPGRVLFSQDTDLLAEAARRQRQGEHFAGLIYAAMMHVPIGRCVDDLELLAKALDPPEMENRVVYLPFS